MVIEVMSKTIDTSCSKPVEQAIPDLKRWGNAHQFKLICKASSKSEGWMKSTKAMDCGNGCLVQVSTQQQNPDGSYALAEALTFTPNVKIIEGAEITSLELATGRPPYLNDASNDALLSELRKRGLSTE